MKESNMVNDCVFPIDCLLVGDIFSPIGSPNIFCKLLAKSNTQVVCKYLTGPYTGEAVNVIPTTMVVKEPVH